MPRVVPRLPRLSCLVVLSALLGGCAHGRRPASYLPVGAPAQYGDLTRDGVVLLLAAPEARVAAAVERALAAGGYAVARRTAAGRVLETAARATGGDTTLAVRVEIMPPDPSGGGTVVVFTGRYSVPSARIRDAQVIERPGERNPLYATLAALGAGARRLVATAP